MDRAPQEHERIDFNEIRRFNAQQVVAAALLGEDCRDVVVVARRAIRALEAQKLMSYSTRYPPSVAEEICDECGVSVVPEKKVIHDTWHQTMKEAIQKTIALHGLLDNLASTEGLRLADLIGHVDPTIPSPPLSSP